MIDILAQLTNLRRPHLLIRAARFGLVDYNRSRDLKRVMRTPHLPGPATALARLIDEEARLEDTRRAGDAAYSVTRHVELLIALMAEARLLPREEAKERPAA